MRGAQGGQRKEGSVAPVVAMGFMGVCCLGPLVFPPLLGLLGAAGLTAGMAGWGVGAVVFGVALLGGGLGCLVQRARRRALDGGGCGNPEARARLRRLEGNRST